MLLPSGSQPKQRTLYKCEKDRHVTDSKYAARPNCYAEMNYQLWYVEFQNAKNILGGGGGVVMPLTTYMVTDDLHVKPFSMISSVDLLQNNVKNAEDICDLEERFVEFGPNEKKEVYEGEGRLRMAEEDRMEALKRKLKLVAVDQNEVPPRVTIHRNIIGPSNRQGPADQPARCISPSRPGTGSKTIVSRTKAKSHRRDVRKQSPSTKRRAVEEEEDEVEEVQPEMKVAEQFKNQFSIIAKEPEELKKEKASEEKDPLNEFNAPLSEEVQKDEKYILKRELEEAFSQKRKGGAPRVHLHPPNRSTFRSPKDMF
ncbi:hypothetical protein Q3G72_025921 [Acer saccharum]|nr:hypothetical protein Q3G72_025921 [Acer saccharum]